jgi:hypothetical protein
MFRLPSFHRWFFRITGKIYSGPMVTCLVFVLTMLTNIACSTPLPFGATCGKPPLRR